MEYNNKIDNTIQDITHCERGIINCVTEFSTLINYMRDDIYNSNEYRLLNVLRYYSYSFESLEHYIIMMEQFIYCICKILKTESELVS